MSKIYSDKADFLYNFGENTRLLKGDFIGFTFGNKHSSELGIVRVSNGSRYEESLLPSSNSQTVTVPGGDGVYYFGSNYTNRVFNIQIAFDELTQVQFSELRRLFGSRDEQQLIFDETPYKVYMARVEQSPNFTYICFDVEEEGQKQRIYKGEGTIQFTCYYPFAKSRFKYLDEYANITNINEWSAAAGIIKNTNEGYDKFENGQIKVYNGGDMDTDFNLYIPIAGTVIPELTIGLMGTSDILKIKNGSAHGGDNSIRINTKTNLIEGVDSERNFTGRVYNNLITSGVFFKIPQGKDNYITISGLNENVIPQIEYNYLYY